MQNFCKVMVAMVNKLSAWQVALIILVVGLGVYSTGFSNPFQGDDLGQIINNVPVHSVRNVRLFFEGSTFYYGNGSKQLVGNYYRPLMTTVFSLIYSIFGTQAIYFHIVQLLIFLTSALLLYLIFRYSFKPALSLSLALIYIVHPLNSEEVFAIPVMQDTLYLFFGLLGVYLLFRFSSIKSLVGAVVCLALSAFSKETGLLFTLVSAVYLFWWNRKRLVPFVCMILPVLLIYVLLHHHAVGILRNPSDSPIDIDGLNVRLLTIPSIFLFYIAKFIFPWRLSNNYFWVDKSFTISGVLIPLLLDIVIIGLIVGAAIYLKRSATKARYYTYLFFSVWFGLGMLLNLQIILLDCTTCEPWFSFSMIGLLGMLGVIFEVMKFKNGRNWLVFTICLIVILLGFRTAMRGLDWRNSYKLASIDLKASSDNYVAKTDVAEKDAANGHFQLARVDLQQSIDEFPNFPAYSDLGYVDAQLGNYSGAEGAYRQAMHYGSSYAIYENLAELTLLYGTRTSDQKIFTEALMIYPHDPTILTYLAILECQYKDIGDAKRYIIEAAKYGTISPNLYDKILNGQPITLTLSNLNKRIIIE
jgi:hypothetical protein